MRHVDVVRRALFSKNGVRGRFFKGLNRLRNLPFLT